MDSTALWLSGRLAAETMALLVAIGIPVAYWIALST
jgi:ABC-type molybdate transport system permease subunit